MTKIDRRGIEFSSGSAAALGAYDSALEALNSYFDDPVALIDKTLAHEPEFLAGHCLRAGVLAMSTQKNLEGELRASVEAAERLATRGNERERGHIRAAHAWLDGDFAGAIELWGAVAIEHPRDLLAVQLAHLGDFYHGQSLMLRDRIARVMHAWDEKVPGYGYVLGMYAFGLEEMGDYAQAESLGRRAVEINRRDVWAIHAVAHVYEMQARLAEGMDWLESRAGDWSPGNAFAYHNWWHLALYRLDVGDCDGALELYDTRIRPKPSAVALEMVDASALLWRLKLRGAKLGERWHDWAGSWAPMAEDGYYAFNDCHAQMAFAADGRKAMAERVLATLRRRAGEHDTNARMTADVGLPVAQAIAAFAQGYDAEAINRLLPLRHIAARFGGSHAQRDILGLTLFESALRSGNVPLARALASERTAAKPGSPVAWQFAARAAKLAGDARGAQAAGAKADALIADVRRARKHPARAA